MARAAAKKAAPSNTTLRQAYGQATQALRDNHRDEFEKLYTEAARALGIERAPRLTAEQKAEQEFDGLLRMYPHLRERVVGDAEGAAEGPGEGE